MREKSHWLRICIFSEFSTFACIWQIWQICRANIVFTYVNDNYQPHYKFCWMRLNMSTCLIHPTNNEPATVAKCSISNDGILQILRRFSYLNVTVCYHENESDRTLTTKCHTETCSNTNNSCNAKSQRIHYKRFYVMQMTRQLFKHRIFVWASGGFARLSVKVFEKCIKRFWWLKLRL